MKSASSTVNLEWRGVNVDLRNATPIDLSGLNPEVVMCAREGVKRLVDVGFSGVRIVEHTDETTGKCTGSLLIDINTIEGLNVACLLQQLPSITEPFEPEAILSCIVFSYLSSGIRLPMQLREIGSKR